MTYEYARLDLMRVIAHGIELNWLHSAPDCEYREDYQCFFILRGSRTYTLAILRYGDCFD
jgi:hypothetical protein